MMKIKTDPNIKKNNNGAALITCIIIIFFISILATVVLYIAGSNYRMKKADYKTKVSFYINEKPLETMQTNLIIPVSESLNEAYAYTVSNYASLGGYRKEAFRGEMFENLKDSLVTMSGDDVKTLVSALSGVSDTNITIPSDYSYTAAPDGFADFAFEFHSSDFSSDGQYIIVPYDSIFITGSPDLSFIELPLPAGIHDKDVKIYLKKVTVITVQDGYRSVIKTDIAVSVPPLDWSGGSMVTESGRSYVVNDLIYYNNWNNE